MAKLAQFQIEKGRLIFALTDEGKRHVSNAIADGGVIGSDASFLDLVEWPLCNGLSLVPPEDIGALTSSLIFSDCCVGDDGEWPADARYFWFERYQIESPAETLTTKGAVEFQEGT